MPGRRLWPYGIPSTHEAVSDLIRKHSTNPRDVRKQALEHHDLSNVRTVLDLGCGFGFMAQEVAGRAHPEAVVTGLDACAANWRPFVLRVRAAGRVATFRRMRLGGRLPWPGEAFDLVVCSYSLYFFPEILPEVARVLRPDGQLLAVTHSEESVRDILALVGIEPGESVLLTLVRRFSAESGRRVLSACFENIERTEYRNALRFEVEDLDDLLTYLRFKFRFLDDWPESEPELHRLHERDFEERLACCGPVVLRKDDVAFWAGGPRGEGVQEGSG
ncbi:MAG: class I SAM-dependent methyltransferase [Thermoleophilia bacterium]